MPYLEKSVKEALDNRTARPACAGHLNYMFTKISTGYIDDCDLSYQTINDIIGALEGCKLEMYRRVAAPYENTKIKSNGDVYEGVF